MRPKGGQRAGDPDWPDLTSSFHGLQVRPRYTEKGFGSQAHHPLTVFQTSYLIRVSFSQSGQHNESWESVAACKLPITLELLL